MLALSCSHPQPLRQISLELCRINVLCDGVMMLMCKAEYVFTVQHKPGGDHPKSLAKNLSRLLSSAGSLTNHSTMGTLPKAL